MLLLPAVLVLCIIMLGYHQILFASGLGGEEDVALVKARANLKRAISKSQTMDGYDAGGLQYKTGLAQFPADKKWDVCTVGAGISGSVMAERYAKILGKTTLVMDIR